MEKVVWIVILKIVFYEWGLVISFFIFSFYFQNMEIEKVERTELLNYFIYINTPDAIARGSF